MLDRDVTMYGARKGDPAYMYRNCREGAVDLWVHGRFIRCAEAAFSSPDGYRCAKNCDGRWHSLGKSEWWVQIRLKSGATGWVLVDDNFDGTDALA